MRPRLSSLTALRTFEAVSRLKSFKKASQELNVTPSAVSHQIKHLEVELGCRLSHRGRKGFQLTRQGKTLANTVRRSFDRIGETLEELKADGEWRIYLQVYSTFAVRWLLPRLSSFRDTYPDFEIRLITSQADVNLAESSTDACVMIGRPDQKGVDYTLLFTSSVYPVCSPEYLSEHGPIETPDDLASHVLLQVYPSQDDWTVWLNEMGATSVDSVGETRFDSYDHALNMAVQGLGVALAIEPFAQEDIEAGRLVEVFAGQRIQLPREWYFACLSGKRGQPKIEALRQWLLDELDAARAAGDAPDAPAN